MLRVIFVEINAIALVETVFVKTIKFWITAHVRLFIISQESKTPVVQCHIHKTLILSMRILPERERVGSNLSVIPCIPHYLPNLKIIPHNSLTVIGRALVDYRSINTIPTYVPTDHFETTLLGTLATNTIRSKEYTSIKFLSVELNVCITYNYNREDRQLKRNTEVLTYLDKHDRYTDRFYFASLSQDGTSHSIEGPFDQRSRKTKNSQSDKITFIR